MKTICFAGTKGGCGRSTLCWNVAIAAVRARHSVYLIDRDPQRTVHGLWLTRARVFQDDGSNPQLLTEIDTVASAKRELIETGKERDFLLIDLPGSFMPIIRDAVGAADCIVMPTQPSPKDVLAQAAMSQVLDECGKAEHTILVLNRVDPQETLVSETAQQLKPLSSLMLKIRQRVSYRRADLTGRAAVEIDPDAAEEIAQLWRRILAVLRKTDNEGTKRKP